MSPVRPPSISFSEKPSDSPPKIKSKSGWRLRSSEWGGAFKQTFFFYINSGSKKLRDLADRFKRVPSDKRNTTERTNNCGINVLEVATKKSVDLNLRQAAKNAKKGIKNADSESVNSYTKLISESDPTTLRQGKEFETATETATLAIKSKGEEVKLAGLKLFMALLESARGDKETGSQQDVEDQHFEFSDLVLLGNCFNAAANVATGASEAFRAETMPLLSYFVSKIAPGMRPIFKPATISLAKTAKELLKSDNVKLKSEGLICIAVLVAEQFDVDDSTINLAIETAKKGLGNEDTHLLASNLLEVFKETGFLETEKS